MTNKHGNQANVDDNNNRRRRHYQRRHHNNIVVFIHNHRHHYRNLFFFFLIFFYFYFFIFILHCSYRIYITFVDTLTPWHLDTLIEKDHLGAWGRTVVCDWHFDNLCGGHLQSQVIVLVSWKFKNPGERFDWSIDRVAVGKCVMWLAVKTCAEMCSCFLMSKLCYSWVQSIFL